MPLFTHLPRGRLLGNPYAAGRILMREDRGKVPFHFPVSIVDNTTSGGLA
jgi:hypothetical protein